MSALCYNVSVDKVAYTTPAARYLEKRGLRRPARAVISDDFLGWNVGLTRGFGGMLGARV